MAPDGKPINGSSYQLDRAQTDRAATALLNHITETSKKPDGKAELFDDDPSNPSDSQPIWLVVTTKKHIVPHTRLKPAKITLPHPNHHSANSSICLITPDPQRSFKALIAHPAFPRDLAKRITRVIDTKRLQSKYHSFESRRQLRDSHDLFLADDRIITYLAKILGKTFYASTSKRPIPISLEGNKPKAIKNPALPSHKPKKDASNQSKSICTPDIAAKELSKTLMTTSVHLSSSVTTSVKVGLSHQTPAQISENIDAVVKDMAEKYIPRKWAGLRAVHVKGPNTMALPIWMTDELWEDAEQIIPDEDPHDEKAEKDKKKINKSRPLTSEGVNKSQEKKNKRKDVDNGEHVKVKKQRVDSDAGMSAEMRARREKLRQQRKDIKASLK